PILPDGSPSPQIGDTIYLIGYIFDAIGSSNNDVLMPSQTGWTLVGQRAIYYSRTNGAYSANVFKRTYAGEMGWVVTGPTVRGGNNRQATYVVWCAREGAGALTTGAMTKAPSVEHGAVPTADPTWVGSLATSGYTASVLLE